MYVSNWKKEIITSSNFFVHILCRQLDGCSIPSFLRQLCLTLFIPHRDMLWIISDLQSTNVQSWYWSVSWKSQERGDGSPSFLKNIRN